MYVLVEENPNAAPEERVFAASGPVRTVRRVHVTPPTAHAPQWCDVVGVDENGVFTPAQVVRVEDSADGTAWLVHGALWGIRLKPKQAQEDWDLHSTNQWGMPFLVLDSSDASIEVD